MAALQPNPATLTFEDASPTFFKYLQSFSRDIEGVLEGILPSSTTRLHQAMGYSVLKGGKRLRSFLLWTSSQLFDVAPLQALKTAAVLELIQSYSLVHDDLPCMDNADFRRGRPSCHKAFGEATATLVGDALIPLSFQTLASLDMSPKIRLELVEGLGRTIGSEGLVAGQMRDLGQEEWPRTYEGLLELERLKTGVLFEFALEAGAILGQASLSERQALKSYGRLFGQAFQMMDDWLDGCSDEKTLGKPCGQDRDKFTFLTLLGPSLLHEKIELIISEAVKTLEPFHEKAASLKKAAFYIMSQGQ